MKSDLSKVKVGDKIWTIQFNWAEVTEIDDDPTYPIKLKNGVCYSLKGKFNLRDSYPSAFLECPFKELPIKKDTVVWFKDSENSHWINGYYSHFDGGQHFCFNGSKKSTETTHTVSWKIVTTENPLQD